MNKRLDSHSFVRRGLIAVALVSAGGLGATGLHKVWADNPPPVLGAPLGNKTASLIEIENGFTAIADRISPSIVTVEVEKKVKIGNVGAGSPFDFGNGDDNSAPRGFQLPGGGGRTMPQEYNAKGSGSGVIVRSDGWILTNDHVVGGADKVSVTLHDGRVLPGTVRRDFMSDLAVIKVEASGLQQVEFANSDKVKVGQWAVAFGSPFDLSDTMTVGVISARQRQKLISEGGERRFYPSLLQTDASINPGNSGGALVDSMGRVMGINVAIGSPNGGNVGIGFAFPSNAAKDIMDKLVNGGKVVRGYLGVAPKSLGPDQRARYGVKSGGALIEHLNVDTPAAKAGLQVEDVIIRFDGKQIDDDIALRTLVSRVEPGRRVDVVVVRDGSEKTIPVTIGKFPTEGTPVAAIEKPAASPVTMKLGVAVAAITDAIRTELKLPVGTSGLVVREISPGSPATEVGVQVGDVITRVNGRPMTKPEDLRAAIADVRSGEMVRMVIQRAGSRTLINVPMP